MSETRIYVASLSDYNNMILHGVWIDVDLNTTADDIQAEVDEMLKRSPMHICFHCGIHRDEHDEEMAALPEMSIRHSFEGVEAVEEWAIHDHEGFGGKISEWSTWDEVIGWAHGITMWGEGFVPFAEHMGETDPEQAASMYRDQWAGMYRSAEDFAEEFHEMCGHIDEKNPLTNYIDWERVWRDMTYDGYFTIELSYNEVLVFHPC